MFLTMTVPRVGKTSLQFLWEDPIIPSQFRSGVSLHSHTMYSEESLDVLVRHVSRVPVLSRTLPKHIDYGRVFWTPPLSPRRAYRVEEKQIQRLLNLPALVSLTDHDDIQAGMLLRVIERYRDVPISVEWTVPFGATFFHIGVHNLPPSDASRILRYLEGLAARPTIRSLQERLSFLNTHRGILLVLNHPFWDEKGIGHEAHVQALYHLLSVAQHYLHALELNGLRPCAENRKVMRVANELGLPALSGGDRHGCEPNSIVNLSETSSFAEFAEDIRKRRTSHVVFMPQYRQPLSWRTTQTTIDVLRDYPASFAERRFWSERVFYRTTPGTAASIASLIREERMPGMFKLLGSVVRLVQCPGMPALLRTLMSVRHTEWRSLNIGAANNGAV